MARMMAQPCWRVWGWDRDVLTWTVRSAHPTFEAASEAAEFIAHRDRIRTRVARGGSRRVAVATEAHAPTAAKAFREAQADAVEQRRQSRAYFKSGLSAHPQSDE